MQAHAEKVNGVIVIAVLPDVLIGCGVPLDDVDEFDIVVATLPREEGLEDGFEVDWFGTLSMTSSVSLEVDSDVVVEVVVDVGSTLSTSNVVAAVLLLVAAVFVFAGSVGSTTFTPNVLNQKSLSECTPSRSGTSGSVSGTSGKPNRPSNNISSSSLL